MFDKKNTYFPIKQQPACQLKWTWSTLILTEGITSSCHRCLKVPIDKKNFDTFHNLPHKVKEREIMLSGKWPTIENGGSGHCTYCKTIEDTGGTSDRLHHLAIPNLTPKELIDDNNAVHVTPKILEIFMNKTCNLKCTYCNTRNSSQWTAEAKKFGDLKDTSGKALSGYQIHDNVKEHRVLFEKTLDWVSRNGNELRRLHLLGGETFYQSELQEMIDTLKKIKNPHLELNIVSNLMVKEDIYKNYIDQIKKLCLDRNIGRFDLTCSIDGWGDEVEYARFGIKLDNWLKLFEYTVNEKWIFLNINQVITSLTLKSTPRLLEIINNFRKIRTINQEITFVDGREWMHPKIYGKNFWQQDIQKILDAMPEDNVSNQQSKKYMAGCLNSLPIQPNSQLIIELKHFLDQLDARRNTNWRKVFPYLDI